MSEPNSGLFRSDGTAFTARRLGVALLVIVASLIGLSVIAFAASHIFYWSARHFFIGRGIQELPSVNPHFIRAGAALLALGLGAVLFLRRNGEWRALPAGFHVRWIVATAVIYIGWNFALGIVKRDQLFDYEGRPATHWSARPDGSIYIAHRESHDPVTGAKLREITPDAAVAIWHWKKGPPKKLAKEPERFVHPVTGDPVVWVGGESIGETTFYDGPGFDEATGEILVPADREWLAKYHEEKHAAQVAADERMRRREAEAAEAEAAEAERVRQKGIRDLLDTGLVDPEADAPHISVSVSARNGESVSHEITADRIADVLKTHLPEVRYAPGFFRPEFFESATGRQLLSKGWAGENGVDELRAPSAHLVCEVKAEESSLPANENLVQVRSSISISLLNEDGRVAATGSVEGTGAGFSSGEAATASIQRGFDRGGTELLGTLRQLIADRR